MAVPRFKPCVQHILPPRVRERMQLVGLPVFLIARKRRARNDRYDPKVVFLWPWGQLCHTLSSASPWLPKLGLWGFEEIDMFAKIPLMQTSSVSL